MWNVVYFFILFWSNNVFCDFFFLFLSALKIFYKKDLSAEWECRKAQLKQVFITSLFVN